MIQRVLEVVSLTMSEMFFCSRCWTLQRHRSATRLSALCWVLCWAWDGTMTWSGKITRSRSFTGSTHLTRRVNQWVRSCLGQMDETVSVSMPRELQRYCLASLWRRSYLLHNLHDRPYQHHQHRHHDHRRSIRIRRHTSRRTGQWFLGGGLSHLCPKNFSTSPKNCYADLQNYFARLTPPGNY